jgi:membrane-associated protease RseP (regulator of RpoE activity)
MSAWQAGKTIELERRRPVVGLTIGPGAKDGVVIIERVEPAGPADKAGLAVGDQIVEADGHKIRSAYQAISSILKKQPGDKFSLTVLKDNQPTVCEMTLGGSATTPGSAPNADGAKEPAGYHIGPQLKVTARDGGPSEVRNGSGVQEVAVDANRPVRKVTNDEQEMLRIQVSAFAKVIEKLQSELKNRDQSQAEQQQQIETLKREVERLEKQLHDK